MSNIKILTAILGFLTILLLLVLLRSFDQDIFKGDVHVAVKDAGSAIVTPEELLTLGKPYHIIDLDGKKQRFEAAIPILFRDLLSTENLRLLKTLDGKILLYSEVPATSEKAWVILNQLKLEQVKILSDVQFPESLKYEFQPDTTVRLEFN